MTETTPDEVIRAIKLSPEIIPCSKEDAQFFVHGEPHKIKDGTPRLAGNFHLYGVPKDV